MAALWLILVGIVVFFAWTNAIVAERVLELGWRGALASRRGYLLPLFPVLTLACLPFMASSAQHFAEFGRKVVVIKDGKLYRAGFEPIALDDIVDVVIQEGRHTPFVMAVTRSGRRHFVRPWLAGPDADSISLGIRRALDRYRAERPPASR